MTLQTKPSLRTPHAGRQALDDFQQASRSAAASLQAIAAAAPTVAAVPGPAVPLQFGPNAPSFLTLLLGSVTDNQLAGITFQETVLQDLGLPENFMLIPPELLLARARPDAITTTDLYEIKNGVYQARTRQIRIQMRYAEENGIRFRLIVRRWTRISVPLRDRIRQSGGSIFRAQDNGLYTRDNGTEDTAPALYRCVNGSFERVNLAPRVLTAPHGPAAGGGAGSRGAEDRGAAEPNVPEEPVAPKEVPEIPEPEIFLPELP